MPRCIILSGIPCSGKSTWAEQQNLPIISCDKIRKELFGKTYKQTFKNEIEVWDKFYEQVNSQTTDFIVDNTNCKLYYQDRIRENLYYGEVNPKTWLIWEIEVKRFATPLWKAYYRNVVRYLKTGEFIPFKIIKNMKKNYDILYKRYPL